MEEKGQRGEGERRGEPGRVGEEEELEGGVPKVANEFQERNHYCICEQELLKKNPACDGAPGRGRGEREGGRVGRGRGSTKSNEFP